MSKELPTREQVPVEHHWLEKQQIISQNCNLNQLSTCKTAIEQSHLGCPGQTPRLFGLSNCAPNKLMLGRVEQLCAHPSGNSAHPVIPQMGVAQNLTGGVAQVLVHDSTYQGNPFTEVF